jgi:hypothetical protein
MSNRDIFWVSIGSFFGAFLGPQMKTLLIAWGVLQ